MLYATSKDRFRRELEGVHYELQATDPTEMELDVLKDRARWLIINFKLSTYFTSHLSNAIQRILFICLYIQCCLYLAASVVDQLLYMRNNWCNLLYIHIYSKSPIKYMT